MSSSTACIVGGCSEERLRGKRFCGSHAALAGSPRAKNIVSPATPRRLSESTRSPASQSKGLQNARRSSLTKKSPKDADPPAFPRDVKAKSRPESPSVSSPSTSTVHSPAFSPPTRKIVLPKNHTLPRPPPGRSNNKSPTSPAPSSPSPTPSLTSGESPASPASPLFPGTASTWPMADFQSKKSGYEDGSRTMMKVVVTKCRIDRCEQPALPTKEAQGLCAYHVPASPPPSSSRSFSPTRELVEEAKVPDIDLIKTSSFLVDLTKSSAFAKFSPKLSHKADAILEQIKSGLYTLKRFVTLVKACAEGQKAYAKCVLEATDLVTDRKDKLALDLMTKHAACFRQLNSYMEKTGDCLMKFSEQAINEIVDPMVIFYKDAESQLKKFTEEEKELRDAIAALATQVQKEKDECQKSYTAFQEVAHSQDVKKDKLAKALTKTQAAYTKYEDFLKNANKTREEQQTKLLPILITQLERLEVARLRCMDTHLRKYTELRNQLDVHLKTELNLVKTMLNNTSVDEALEHFIQEVVLIYGSPPPYKPFPFELPALPASVDEST